MYYSIRTIINSLPKSKNSNSSLWVKLLIRRISFLFTWLFINLGFSSNAISYLSILVALCGSLALSINSITLQIVGVILINLWLVLDCVDGNIARCKKTSSAIGSLIDAFSGYFMVAFGYIAIGIAAYNSSGILFDTYSVILIILGGVASISDILSRLIHQKYSNTMMFLAKQNIPDTNNKKSSRFSRFRIRIGKEFGISGLFMPGLILSLIFSAFDLMIIFYFCFNSCALLISVLYYSFSAESYMKRLSNQ